MIKITELIKELGASGLTLREYFNYLRLEYLRSLNQNWEKNWDKSPKIFIERVLGKCLDEIITGEDQPHPKLARIAAARGDDWKDLKFHREHILDSAGELAELFPGIDAQKVIIRGYHASLMPLPLAVGSTEWLSKIVPKTDFFEPHPAKKTDPYGIFEKGTSVYHGRHYLGSQKFPRSFLMNITNVCPHGCVDCYKGVFTRVKGAQFFTNLDQAISAQSELLAEYLNENPLIQTVIVSGGEPLLLDNAGIKQMLGHFKKAKHLAEFRICTGTLFQGEPFRIEDELLDLLKCFESETGIRVHFNAHLNHPAQFVPEALVAVDLIHRYGFSINSQVPLQEGVNVFRKDYPKTMGTLYRLAELQGRAGIRPYKYILHMNSGSLDYSVPLEFMLKVLGELKYRPDHPLPETWQPVSMSILCSEGNILLSPQMALGLKKEVFDGYVEYQIPVPGEKGLKYVSYREPIMAWQ